MPNNWSKLAFSSIFWVQFWIKIWIFGTKAVLAVLVLRVRAFFLPDAVFLLAGQVTVLTGRSNKTIQHEKKKQQKEKS